MGTSLSGTQIKNTYNGILKAGDNAAISSTLKTISDGEGNDTALAVSSSQVKVTNLLIDSPATSGADEVLVRDSSTGLIGKRRFPSFKSVTVTAGQGNSDHGGGTEIPLTFNDSTGAATAINYQSGANMVLSSVGTTYTFGYSKRKIKKVTATTSLPKEDNGATLFCDASTLGGGTITLPGASEGVFLRVYVDVAGGAFDINAASGDYFYGAINVLSTTADNQALQTVTRATASGAVASHNQLTIHAVASTTGGAAGSYLELTCIDTNGWFVTGHLISTHANPGSIATINGQ